MPNGTACGQERVLIANLVHALLQNHGYQVTLLECYEIAADIQRRHGNAVRKQGHCTVPQFLDRCS